MTSARRCAAASVPTIALRWRPSSPPRGAAGDRGAARSNGRSTPGCTARPSSSWSCPLVLLLATVTKPTALQAPTLPPAFDATRRRRARTRARHRVPRPLARQPGRARGGGLVPRRRCPSSTCRREPPRGGSRYRGSGVRSSGTSWRSSKGQSSDVIVVMAHRDDTGAGPGANDNASGTAALLELARTYARPQSETQTAVQPVHTLVFLSTDAGAFGGLGALRFARAARARPCRRRAQPRRARRARAGAHRARRRPAALSGHGPRADGFAAHRRADRRAGRAPGRRRAADRPRLPVHVLRAGPVRRARDPRDHADDLRQAGPRPRSATAPGGCTCASWRSSADRRRRRSDRSTAGSSWRRERRATSGSGSESCAAGRSSWC